MIVLTAPEERVLVAHDSPVIFMAGGITGCADWQDAVLRSMKDLPSVTFINPRRRDFNVNDPRFSEEQIIWEYRYLEQSDFIFFWFPAEGACMITLFELGWALGANKEMRIGCHPDYARAFDVHHQVKLRRPDLKIYDNVFEMYNEVDFN
jgi:hypothetical protein